jgi:hypothetical protein
VEFVNLSGNKHGAGRSSPAFSMGSGHKPINNTSIVSPGPCYKVRASLCLWLSVSFSLSLFASVSLDFSL